MKNYQNLIEAVLEYGVNTTDRTGVGTRKVFGAAISFYLQQGFPIVTSRKIMFKQAVGELAGFLEGATSKQRFTDLGCTYWNTTGDLDDLGPIYGAQWVQPDPETGLSQLGVLMDTLKRHPDSRRMILSTWNVKDLHKMALPPCHLIAQFDVDDGKLNCIVYMRSCDLMLGLPYDIVIYALLTHLIAQELDLTPNTLSFFIGNAHVYKNHFKQAETLINSDTHHQPTLWLDSKATVFNFKPSDARLVNYYYNDPLVIPLNL